MEQRVGLLERLAVEAPLHVAIVCEGVPVFVIMGVVGTGDPLPVRLAVRLTVKDVHPLPVTLAVQITVKEAHPLPVSVPEPVTDPREGLSPIETDPVPVALCAPLGLRKLPVPEAVSVPNV